MPRIINPDGSQIVADRNLILGNTSFKRTDNGTEKMNVDGRAAGAQLIVWNGTGAGDTGGDWTASGDGSQQAAAAFAGTNGWDSGLGGANRNTKFANGSAIAVAGVYSTLTFMLQPKVYPGNAQFQMQWKNLAGAVIGNTLLVPSYTTNMDLNVWQQVQVPIADFGLTENVESFNLVYKVGNQQHWIDDIKLQASGGGGPYTFQIVAPTGENWHATMMVLTIAAPSTNWNSSAFANIAGGLTNGVLLRQRKLSTSETVWQLNSKDNIDLFGRYHPQDDFEFANGELLLGFMVKPGNNASVIVTDDRVLEFVVRDNLSTLNNMRAFYHYGVEVVV